MNHEETTKSMIDIVTSHGISHALNHMNIAMSILFLSISIHLIHAADLHFAVTVVFGSAIYGNVMSIKNTVEKAYGDKSQLSYEIRLCLAAYVYVFYTVGITQVIKGLVMYL